VPTFRRSLVLFIALLASLFAAKAEAQPHGRIQTGLRSTDGLKADLKYIVQTLGGNAAAYTDLEDTVAVFAIGVDTTKPVGMDIVIDPFEPDPLGAIVPTRRLFHVPVTELANFIRNNLNPIGINARRRGRTLYELNALKALGWAGWMQVFDSDYVSIGNLKSDVDIDAGVTDPAPRLTAMFAPGYDAAILLDNGPFEDEKNEAEERRKALAEMKKRQLEKLRRRTTESVEEFELRKLAVGQRMDRLQRLYVEVKKLSGGWTTDSAKGSANGLLSVTALDKTSLKEWLDSTGKEASRFSVVPETKDAVFSARANLPIDKFQQDQFKVFYEALRPVLKERLSKQDDATEAERTARQKVADLFIDELLSSLSIGLDGFIETIPTTGDKHSVVTAVRITDGAKILPILQQLPQAFEGWKLQEATETVEGVTIHRIDITGDLWDSLKDFYGASGEIFVGVEPDAVWIAGGNNCLDRLKKSIETVKSGSPAADGIVLKSKMRVGPIVRHLKEVGKEQGFSLEELTGSFKEGRVQQDAPRNAGDKERVGSNISKIDWQTKLEGGLKDITDDIARIEIKVDKGELTVASSVENGLLKGIGRVLGKITNDLIGG